MSCGTKPGPLVVRTRSQLQIGEGPGGGLLDNYDAEPGSLHVYAPIQMTPPIGPGGISKFGHHIFTSGGTDCTDAGPFGTYRWTVTGSTLTLTVIHEGCRGRGALWEGTWTRTTT